VATFFMSRGTQTRYLESEVEDRYIQLTELLRVSAEDAVVAEDLTLLADLVADLGDGDHSIALLQITNDEGRVIAEWRTPRADGESVLILPPAVIELDGRSQGEIRLQVDLAYEYAIINAFVLRNASTIAILVIGLLIVQLVLINRRAIKPVLRIKERLKAVETGDLRTDFEAAGSREFAQLASSLNEVAETLNTRRISEKKARDELEQTLDDLGASLAQKKLLIRELHHRVKNNLQLIASLMRLQIRRHPGGAPPQEPELQAMLGRLQTMARAHDRLYHDDDTGTVSLRRYLTGLTADLRQLRPGVTVDGRFAEMRIGLPQAVPVGLITNELATNALKHAFPRGRGTLRLRAEVVDGDLAVTVEDDGIGCPPEMIGIVTPGPSMGLGMTMVISLVTQLRGAVSIAAAEPGTRVRVVVPRAQVT
jgi:two-component sensor histidine kinase/molybdopterin converting factor small subunit